MTTHLTIYLLIALAVALYSRGGAVVDDVLFVLRHPNTQNSGSVGEILLVVLEGALIGLFWPLSVLLKLLILAEQSQLRSRAARRGMTPEDLAVKENKAAFEKERARRERGPDQDRKD